MINLKKLLICITQDKALIRLWTKTQRLRKDFNNQLWLSIISILLNTKRDNFKMLK
jgi:hypothetical protein